MFVQERILVMGGPGTGKSYQWLKMAEILLKTGVKFWVLDTDNDILYMLVTQFPHLMPENGGNVYVHAAYSWDSYSQGLEWAKKQSKQGDWFVCDMVDEAWSGVQRHFVGEVYDKSMGIYFLEVRRRMELASKSPKSIMQSAFKGWVDWPVVNKLYDDWILPIVHEMSDKHIYVTTKAQPVTADDDPATRLVFGEFGIRPSGQKNLGHQVHACFLLTWDSKDTWYITTAKDRSKRTYFKKIQLHSLFFQYLVAKAHWSIPDSGEK